MRTDHGPRRAIICVLAAASITLAACGADTAVVAGDDTCATDAPVTDAFPVKVEPSYSTRWSVEYHDSYAVLTVPDSEHPDRGDLNYVLVRCGAPAPELIGDLVDAQVFTVPVQRTAINHNNGVAMLDQLGVLSTTVGMSIAQLDLAGEPYMDGILAEANDPVAIAESGDEVLYEATLGVEPDILIMAGYGTGYNSVTDAAERGLPAVMVSNRIEPEPLGSAEWMKFLSVFYGTEQVANDRFTEIEAAYEQAAASVARKLPSDFSAAYLCIEPDNGCEFVYAHGVKSFNGTILDTLGVTNPFAEGNDAPNGEGFDYEATLGLAADVDFIVDYELPDAVTATLDADSRFDEFAAFANGNYITYVPENYAFCRFNLYVQVDIPITDFAIGMAPDLFPGETGRCFAPPAS
jgi:ABC-type Fe3+-hydroxamate transport system substrate-binding protein